MPAEAYALVDLLGAEVTVGGGPIGRLRDVGVRLEGQTWPVTALRVRSSAGTIDVPWPDVRTLEVDHIEVVVPAPPGTPATDLTWLAAGVVDHELIDVEGKRLVRIGDGDLGRRLAASGKLPNPVAGNPRSRQSCRSTPATSRSSAISNAARGRLSRPIGRLR